MSKRTTPLSVISALDSNLKRSITLFKKEPYFQYEIPDEMTLGWATLSDGLVRSAKRLYGSKTKAFSDYWGADFPQYEKALLLSKDHSGMEAFIKFSNQVSVLAKIIAQKEKEFKDQETVEHRAFNHNGYKVEANDLSEVVIEAMLEPLDVVQHLFKKRGVEVLLHEALEKVLLKADPEDKIDGGWGSARAKYIYGEKVVILYDSILDETCDISGIKGLVYGFIHEIGHWLHVDFLTKDAHEYWNKAWAGVIPEGVSYLEYEVAKENETLNELGIPTAYGRRDPFEDFAETFSFFILAPDKLSERACERMKETLRMSMRGGRVFMRLARARLF